MAEARTRHENALETCIPSIRFHPVKMTSHPSGIVVTPAGQSAKGSGDRICRIARMTAIFAGVKAEPAGGMPRSRTLQAKKKRCKLKTKGCASSAHTEGAEKREKTRQHRNGQTDCHLRFSLGGIEKRHKPARENSGSLPNSFPLPPRPLQDSTKSNCHLRQPLALP